MIVNSIILQFSLIRKDSEGKVFHRLSPQSVNPFVLFAGIQQVRSVSSCMKWFACL